MIYFPAYFYNIPHLEVSQNLKYDFYFPAGYFMALHKFCSSWCYLLASPSDAVFFRRNDSKGCKVLLMANKAVVSCRTWI